VDLGDLLSTSGIHSCFNWILILVKCE